MAAQRSYEGTEGAPEPVLVVGIGASAGGLEPLEQLVSAAPVDCGIAYVIIQHSDPERPSLLADILGGHTSLPVEEITEGASILPDQIWIVPSGAMLTFKDNTFQLSLHQKDRRHHSIDGMLRSLAENTKERAVGVLLSGTGDDGTVGLRALREHGGVTIVQSPSTAVHPGMAESAISAGVVDHVLPVEEISDCLLLLARTKNGGSIGGTESIAEALPKICEILQRRTGNDFSGYKQGTLLRRIRQRIRTHNVGSVFEYVRLLADESSPEPALLVQDLLISVTQFFRNPASFEGLAKLVLPAIVRQANDVHPIRVWVAGCGTGQEAYTIAILLTEQMATVGVRRPVTIFATDIDSEALHIARTARYGEEIRENLSIERRKRFFIHQDQSYIVNSELREMCIFSVHNLIRDPPFSGLDLVVCRNVLIYFDSVLQDRVVPLFHYALRGGGYLFLGPSEDVAAYTDLFSPINKAHRIFQRKQAVVRASFNFPSFSRLLPRFPQGTVSFEPHGRHAKQIVHQAFERMLIEEYAPTSVLVNERGEILSVGGSFARYFTPKAGPFTGNILDHAEGTLRHALRTALGEASECPEAGRTKLSIESRVIVPLHGKMVPLKLTVRPAPGGAQAAGLWVIILEEPPILPSVDEALGEQTAREPIIEHLERELKTTRADLQAAVSELESTNQELKGSNEELMSTNEELQSANEELQTSKEELQSVNEELETVNAELREMVKELAVANSDLQNLLASTSVATIFLDKELSVTRFTPAATALFSLIETDVGRPLADLVPRFSGTDLLQDVRSVLARLSPIEKEVRSNEFWFMLRVLPYEASDTALGGVVVTFTDVTRIKKAEAAVRERERLLKDIIDASPLTIFLKDMNGRFISVNKQFLAFVDRAHEEVIGKTAYDIFPQRRADAYVEHDRRVVESKETVTLEDTCALPDGEHIFLTYRFPLFDSEGSMYGISGIMQDITERKQWERRMRAAERRDRELLETMPQLVWTATADGQRDFFSRQWVEYTGVPAASHLGFGWLDSVHPDDRAIAMEAWKKAAEDASTVEIKHRIRNAKGAYRWFRSRGVSLRDQNGKIEKWIGTSTDIDDLVHAEQASKEANQRKSEFLAVLSHELRNPLAPIRTGLHILARESPGTDRARRAREVIDRQVDHLSRLVDDLLDVTRISQNKVRIQKERTELGAIVRRTVDDYRPLFEKSGVALTVEISDTPAIVHVDPTRIAQVIGNLLQNAAKFTPRAGSAKVSMSFDIIKEYVMIHVQDTGIGMTPETISRLFQPFVQVDMTLDRSKGGLGLGLSLAKSLVELHGGSIEARSAGLGCGSDFVVRLPLAPDALVSIPNVTDRVNSASRRILVIEDNPDGAEALRDLLEVCGHQASVAYDGPTGLAMIRDQRPDVVLCDIGLPGMDGYEVARKVREDPALEGLLLVALTGYSMPEDIEKTKSAGFDRHLSKPPDLKKLEVLLAHLDSRTAS